MTKWLKSAVQVCASAAALSSAYDKTVPRLQKSVELSQASNVMASVGKSCDTPVP